MTDVQPPQAVQIWVDADACPKVIKEILFRASQRTKVPLTLVANHALSVPATAWIKAVQVPQGFDVADNLIACEAQPGDLVVTGDIPLAAQVVEKGVEAVNPRGEHYTKANIRQRLAMRNFMEEMRTIGEARGGPSKLDQRHRQQFANVLDRFLAKRQLLKK
ncbi:YaiI/YqxD family protein [Porticoccus sp. W117]|uniref:YaiI/YqxD family protein n=1 Tax=Porticoccus sp. W117 TaxID=3054777 RepID=UPI00259A89A3|nr:YaiI/YqxD family protein [Porticoccus sp. W117]MDM3871778.1 YaiI/YqxD family protein [Porticoccus sp. W117]